MPNIKEVPTLHTLCLKSIGTFVVNLPSQITPQIQGDLQYVHKDISGLSDALDSIPWCLYDLVAVEVLQAIRNLIKQEKSSYHPLVVNIAELVMNSKLKHLNFSRCPELIRPVLYENLYKLNGLETLIIKIGLSEWCTSNRDAKILKAIKLMSNLRFICLHFDCNDEIVQVISENCLDILYIDVTLSKSVTDQSIPYFLKCSKLQYLQLGGTSVTRPGHARLLSQLSSLRNTGYCEKFNCVAKCMSRGPYNNIKKITTDNFSRRSLKLLGQFYPNLECLSLIFNVHIPEFGACSELVKLKCLKGLLLGRLPKWLPSFLKTFELFGHQLVHIHLEDSSQISVDSLVVIGNCCTNLRSLVMYRVRFETTYDIANRFSSLLKPGSFSKLKKLFWVVSDSATLLQLILTKAIRIKYLHVGYSTDIQHVHIENILRVHRMKYLKELKVLYSKDMNMQTVELLLASCPNLKVLSELKRWKGISEAELIEFQDLIKKRNFDLDVSPIRLSLPHCCENLLTFTNYSKQ